eukprot:2851218-Pleurochrysis_carterae.AAC.1
MTKGDRQTGDASSQQAASLGRIPGVRVGQLVTEHIQVGDVGGKLADGVTQVLVEVGRRALITFRLGSTQRTARHAEAKMTKAR